jgi:hypothetical protein
MKKGKQLIEELRELVEAVPPQFQKKNGGEANEPGGNAGTDQVIKALRDTDYRDKDAFFKMVQLLKGLAVNSEKDDKAKEYLSAVSDALTSAAKKVLGEDVIGEGQYGGSYTREDAIEFIDDLGEMWKQVIQNMRRNARFGVPHKGLPSLKKGIEHSQGIQKRLSKETYKG